MTYIIILLTVVVSFACFGNRPLFERLALRPYDIAHRGQWYRIITHGFVHADWTHLIINMVVLWSFGLNVETIFKHLQFSGIVGNFYLTYAGLYFGALAATALIDTLRMRGNPAYSSIGASGAVSAVVYASIFFAPMSKVYIMGILPLPGIVFGVLYLAYESWSSRRSGDRINHYAHIAGAVFGFLFPLLLGKNMFDVFLRGLGF